MTYLEQRIKLKNSLSRKLSKRKTTSWQQSNAFQVILFQFFSSHLENCKLNFSRKVHPIGIIEVLFSMMLQMVSFGSIKKLQWALTRPPCQKTVSKGGFEYLFVLRLASLK